MNAEAELLRAYREWRRLVQAEAKAILTRNWELLADCHRAILNYQGLVPGLTQATRAEWQRAGDDAAPKEHQLRTQVADLIELTRNNHRLLQAALDAGRQQLYRLGEAGKNLRQLRRAYGHFSTGSRAN
jgi:hypothetical protein